MRRKYIYPVLFLLIAGMSACDKDFVAVNTNPVQPLSLDAGYLFSNAQASSAIPVYYYQIPLVQQVIHPFTGIAEGGNHNVVFDANASITFDILFNGTGNGITVTGPGSGVNGPVALLVNVIDQTKNNAARS